MLLASQVFDGLVGYDAASSAVVPAIAERWDVLDGGRRFVFHLRQGAAFHDGTPVDAAAFVNGWTRLADPGKPAPFAFLLESIEGFREYHTTLKARVFKGIAAPNARTFEVRLTRPWPDFVSITGHPALSPVPAGADQPGFAARPVGNGPYMLAAEPSPTAAVSLERFDGYYGAKARVQRVDFLVQASPEEGWPSFLAGELDVAPIPASAYADAVAEFGNQGVVTLSRLLYCGINQDAERIAGTPLRRAIALAVDRRALVQDVYGDFATDADAIIPPSIPGAQRGACDAPCTRDVARAQALAARAPKKARTLALDFADSVVGQQLAGALVAQLAEVGLTVTPRPHDEASFTALFTKRQHEIFCLVWVGDYPRQQSFLEPLLATGSPDNRVGFSDEELDRLLERARLEQDPAGREAAYAEAERFALRRAALVPIAWFRSHLAAQPYVQGLTLDPMGSFDASALAIAP